MAGVALIGAATDVVEAGPSFCIIGMTVPTVAPIPALVLEVETSLGWLTPSLTSHPNAKCVGYTTEGWNFSANTTDGASLSVDELDTPIRKANSTSTPTAEGNLVSIWTPDILETLFGMEQLDGTSTFERYADQVTSLTDIGVCWVWRRPKPNVPGAYQYRTLRFYRANQTNKFAGSIKNGELFSVACKFEALSQLGRTYEISRWID